MPALTAAMLAEVTHPDELLDLLKRTHPVELWRFMSLGTEQPPRSVLIAAGVVDPDHRQPGSGDPTPDELATMRRVWHGRRLVAAARAEQRAELRRRVAQAAGRSHPIGGSA